RTEKKLTVSSAQGAPRLSLCCLRDLCSSAVKPICFCMGSWVSMSMLAALFFEITTRTRYDSMLRRRNSRGVATLKTLKTHWARIAVGALLGLGTSGGFLFNFEIMAMTKSETAAPQQATGSGVAPALQIGAEHPAAGPEEIGSRLEMG